LEELQFRCVNNDDFVDMDLPQTDPGVPAAGIDPTVAELESLNSIASIFDWLGTAAPARATLVAAFGGGQPRLRDLVYIRGSEWDAAISGISIPGTDGAESTPLAPLQLGHMAMLRRIARPRLGLRAVEATAVPLHRAGGRPQIQGQSHGTAAVTNHMYLSNLPPIPGLSFLWYWAPPWTLILCDFPQPCLRILQLLRTCPGG
jgi:hypothetical protein